MSESKLPFKTNAGQPIGKGQAKAARGGKRRSKMWGTPRQKISGTKVDARRERVERIKWIAKWVVIIPCSIYALSWAFLIFSDLFGS
ncbi:MAG: hypothetical protein PVF89_00055 [Lysobacterales bacterium]|jgi:hypothetical protein